jgi:hypothetical protein
VDNVRVYGSRSASVPVTVGSAETCMIRNQAVNGLSRTKLKSVVVDRAYKFSPLAEKSLKVDYTPPAAVTGLTLSNQTVTQGDGSEEVWTSAVWNPSADGQSGIRRYYVHNTFCAVCAWNENWTDNGLSCSCNSCFSFAQNEMISLGVVVENNAGLRSPAAVRALAYPVSQEMSSQERDYKLLNLGRKVKVMHAYGHDLETSAHPCGFSLFDMMGRKMKEGICQLDEEVDISNLSAGIYLFRLMHGSKVLLAEKIVVSN